MIDRQIRIAFACCFMVHTPNNREHFETSGGWPRSHGKLIKLRVAPVPRLWGPGMVSRGAPSASTRAIASLFAGRSTSIQSLRFRARLRDSDGSWTTANPPALLPALGAPDCDECNVTSPQ